MTALDGVPRRHAPLRRSILVEGLAAGFAKLPGRLRGLSMLSGGRWAFAWSSYAFMFFPAALAVAALEAPAGLTTLASVGLGMVCVSASFASGAVYAAVFLRDRAERPVAIPVQAGYWVSCGLGLGLSRSFCVLAWTDADPDFLLRLIGSVCGASVWVPASAVVQAMLDRRRQRLEELESVKQRLDRIRRSAESSLEEQVAALSAAVRTAVEPHIARLSERVAALGPSLTRNILRSLAADIERVSADVVRLTSHRVVEPGSIGAPLDRRPRIFNSVALDVMKRPIMWPWVGSMMIIVGTGPEIYRTSGAGTVLLGTVSVAASTIVLLLVEQYSVRLPDRHATWLQWVVIALIVLGVGLIPPLVEGIGPNFKVSTQLTPLFLFAPLVALGTVMTSIAVATRRQSIALVSELERQNSVMRAVANQAHLDADDIRRRVAALLHGPVQGRLSAAAMLLSLHLGAQSGRSITAVVEETADLLKEASADLDALSSVPERRAGPAELLRRLETDWQGIVAVTSQYDPAVTPHFSSDSALAATTGELIVDMVTNAARHGRARNAHIEVGVITTAGGPALRVRCENDGTFAPASPSEGGLVKALLRSMDGEWEVTGEDFAVVSTAVIPLRGDVREPNSALFGDFAI